MNKRSDSAIVFFLFFFQLNFSVIGHFGHSCCSGGDEE